MTENQTEEESPPLSDQKIAPGGFEPAREPAFNLAPVIVWLAGICVVVHLVRVYLMDAHQDAVLLGAAAFIPEFYSGRYPIDIYAFTSPVTYSFLHGSMMHLGINMIWLAAFGSPLAYRLGTLRFLGFWMLTAVAAALLHYLLHMNDAVPLIGASGAISGMMGAAARFGFRIDRQARHPAFAGILMSFSAVFGSRTVVTFLTIWMAVNLITGLIGFGPGSQDSIAWEAHIGGFLAGFLLIGWFDREPAPEFVEPDPS
ncbi:rhomboid family intramembrane serine protease [Mesorhizobium sp. NBSH29]|uniref:rhomboid family intramembrane serine protease n=1 Tax=Mesorhizobium sp. NBSH29 TaxID=2654249 RepID=UPI0018966C79|nr:rhomboid family intramembrane serine protease [Mesorhizobium sp. NBSH29]QPC87868.1 rhomboid family intramembrane serine protease [Mesorhizobium sp. NBSH29]